MSATGLDQTTGQPVTPTNQEPMVPQSQVNEIVAGARLDGEKRVRELLEQQAAKIAALEKQLSGGGNAGANAGASQGMQPQQQPDMSQLVQQEMIKQQQLAMEAEQRRQVDELSRTFDSAMKTGKEHYDDFETVTAQYDPVAFAEITLMAARLDNTAHVMYELNKNTAKLASISELAKRSPQMAFAEMKKLSESLKTNEKALANHASPIKPLSNVKASTAGTDNGKRTVTDWKKFYRNKR